MFCALWGQRVKSPNEVVVELATLSNVVRSLLVWAPTISLVAVVPAAELNMLHCTVALPYRIVYPSTVMGHTPE